MEVHAKVSVDAGAVATCQFTPSKLNAAQLELHVESEPSATATNCCAPVGPPYVMEVQLL
jgi:hypothetical protein